MESRLFLLYLRGKLEHAVQFFCGEERIGRLSVPNDSWLGVTCLDRRTLLLWKSHRMRRWLTGLRKGSISSSGKQDSKLGLLERRVKNPLSPEEGADERFHLRRVWYSVMAHSLCFLALDTFYSKPDSVWNPINIKQFLKRCFDWVGESEFHWLSSSWPSRDLPRPRPLREQLAHHWKMEVVLKPEPLAEYPNSTP